MKRDAAGVILDSLAEQQRSVAWLSRETGIGYKTLLRELKHSPESLSMFTVLRSVSALHLDLSKLLQEVAA